MCYFDGCDCRTCYIILFYKQHLQFGYIRVACSYVRAEGSNLGTFRPQNLAQLEVVVVDAQATSICLDQLGKMHAVVAQLQTIEALQGL